MKLVTESRNLTASGLGTVHTATIKTGAHMTAVLASLYRNPVDAMVREYLTNMRDAWVELKRVNPSADYQNCELSLPTVLNPWLVFKDYGIGMSRERLIQNFFSYGDSTKNGNNEETGGLGLGAKVGFAYGNGQQWMISSRYNGEEYTVLAFINDEGIQSFTEVAAQPTTERSGITVSIPIQKKDIAACHAAAIKYVPWFSLGITVLNSEPSVTYPKPTPIMSGKDWFITKGSGQTVIMGDVPYEINPEEFRKIFREVKDWVMAEAFFWNNYVYMTVPIGSVAIVPSRDDLKYNDTTKKVLIDTITAIIADVRAQESQRTNACTTEYEAIRVMQQRTKIYGIDSLCGEFVFQGKTVNRSYISRSYVDLCKLDLNATVSRMHAKSGMTTIQREVYDVKDTTNIILPMSSVAENQKYMILVDDMPKGAVNVAMGYIREHWMSKGKSGNPTKYGHSEHKLFLIKSSLSIPKLQEFFGGIPASQFALASAVSGQVKVVRNTVKGVPNIYLWSSGKSWSARVRVPDGPGPYYYLPLVKDTYTDRFRPNHDVNPQLLTDALIRFTTIRMSTVYGIKTDDVKNFDPAVWLDLSKVAPQKLAEILNGSPNELWLLSSDMANVSTLDSRYRDFITVYKLEGFSPEFTQFAREYDRMKKLKGGTLASIYAMFTNHPRTFLTSMLTPTPIPAYTGVDTLRDRIIRKYPMVNFALLTPTYGPVTVRDDPDTKKMILEYLQKC